MWNKLLLFLINLPHPRSSITREGSTTSRVSCVRSHFGSQFVRVGQSSAFYDDRPVRDQGFGERRDDCYGAFPCEAKLAESLIIPDPEYFDYWQRITPSPRPTPSSTQSGTRPSLLPNPVPSLGTRLIEGGNRRSRDIS
jgi:hypothetical protein